MLAGVMTAFGSPTPAGRRSAASARFDGMMLGAFRRPRVEGRFTGERMRAWDVDWGASTARRRDRERLRRRHQRASSRSGDSTIDVDGRFSLGFPRRDGGEEINARVRMTRRPLADLKHAFELDDYPVDGVLSRRVPRQRPLPGPVRLRPHDDRRRRRLRRAVRDRVGDAALRGQRRPPRRASTCAKSTGRVHRRRVRRLGRHLFVQRRRPARFRSRAIDACALSRACR